MLKQKKRRTPWRKFYDRFDQHVGALMLPHHGSIHNYHDEILISGASHLALATTVVDRKRVADVDETLRSVRDAGKIGIVVDDRPTTSVACNSRRLLAPMKIKDGC